MQCHLYFNLKLRVAVYKINISNLNDFNNHTTEQPINCRNNFQMELKNICKQQLFSSPNISNIIFKASNLMLFTL